MQFKALLGFRSYEAERIAAQQPVIERVQRLIGPHLLDCRFGPVHPHRNGQGAAQRRSGKAVLLHLSPRTQTECDAHNRVLSPVAVPVRG
ncbi:hypothetical protein D3C71_1955270 [compost metagenome]